VDPDNSLMGESCLVWFICVYSIDVVYCVGPTVETVCISFFQFFSNRSFLNFCKIICASEFTISKLICRKFAAVVVIDPHYGRGNPCPERLLVGILGLKSLIPELKFDKYSRVTHILRAAHQLLLLL